MAQMNADFRGGGWWDEQCHTKEMEQRGAAGRHGNLQGTMREARAIEGAESESARLRIATKKCPAVAS